MDKRTNLDKRLPKGRIHSTGSQIIASMKREIMFRAWDTVTKKMMFEGFHVMGEVTAFDMIEGYIFENMEGRKASLERWGDIEIMQYTGLKDKNRKEIYEGDIVTWGSLDQGAPDNEPEIRIATVKFEPDLIFDCQNIKYPHRFHYGSFHYRDTEKYLKVIGNIYEDPTFILSIRTELKINL